MRGNSSLTVLATRARRSVAGWVRPRAVGRDLAFRERVIRSTLVIVIVLTLFSLSLNVLVFQDPWAPISYFSLHVGGLAALLLAAVLVDRGHVLFAGWLLVLVFLMGGGGLILIARTEALAVGVANGLPGMMFVPLVAALVLPRSAVFPTAALAVIVYALSGFGIPMSPDVLSHITPFQFMSFAVPALMIEGALLRQLRLEFDSRLESMSESVRLEALAKQEAERARQRAEHADRVKTQFLATMSHELRTPLNAIIGYDEVMIGGMVGTFTPKQTELLRRIQHNSRRLLALINDVLDLSKIESGSVEIYQSPVSPRKILTDTVESLRSLALEKQLALSVALDESLPELVLGDTTKIQQVVVNLVSNAVKFTDTGAVVVEAMGAGPEDWQFSVRDTGPGIPEDALDLIFEPFKQVDSSDRRRRQGTGLGLSISKRLVEAMGGTMQVTSQLGHGATFTVVLPRVTIPEVAEPASPVS